MKKRDNQKTHIEGEQKTHIEGEQKTHIEGEQKTHIEGEQKTHIEGEQKTHIEGEQTPQYLKQIVQERQTNDLQNDTQKTIDWATENNRLGNRKQ